MHKNIEQESRTILSIRVKAEEYFRRKGKLSGDHSLTADEQLILDALDESQTWFTMCQTWLKRATEAESELEALREKLAAAEDLVGNLAMLVRRLVLSEHPQNGRLKTQAMTYLKKHNLEGGIVRHTTIIGKEASDE